METGKCVWFFASTALKLCSWPRRVIHQSPGDHRPQVARRQPPAGVCPVEVSGTSDATIVVRR